LRISGQDIQSLIKLKPPRTGRLSPILAFADFGFRRFWLSPILAFADFGFRRFQLAFTGIGGRSVKAILGYERSFVQIIASE
jgi:hypothetical protein